MLAGRRKFPQKVARAVIANLHESLTPLVYSTLVPESYVVYLHKDDYAAVEAIIPALNVQIQRALDEATARVEQQRWWQRLLDPTRERMPPIERSPHCSVEILPDPNDEIACGQIGVHSQVRLPARDYSGPATVRVTATVTGAASTTRRSVPLEASPSRPPDAVLVIDDLEGRREHAIVDNPTLIGRGGLGCYVHVRLRAEGIVSKEHCRVRRDEERGEYFVKDLSRNGTFLNGTRLPRGVEYRGDRKHELDGCEVPVPDGARIGLADALHLEFKRVQA